MEPPVLLIVDRDSDNAMSLAMFFESELPNVTVIPSTSPKDAMRILGERAIAMVVADYRLGALNGVQFLTDVLRQRPGVKRVLLTTSAEPELVAAAINRAQVHALFVKPLKHEELVRSVTDLMAEAGAPPWRPAFGRRDH